MPSPMREPSLLLLTALTAGPRHGYALLEEVAALSDHQVRLRPGSLYQVLDRLKEQGLIDCSHHEVVEGRNRTYYVLTEPGTRELETEAARLEARAASARRGLSRLRSGVWEATA